MSEVVAGAVVVATEQFCTPTAYCDGPGHLHSFCIIFWAQWDQQYTKRARLQGRRQLHMSGLLPERLWCIGTSSIWLKEVYKSGCYCLGRVSVEEEALKTSHNLLVMTEESS
jgi:hypothetical protein